MPKVTRVAKWRYLQLQRLRCHMDVAALAERTGLSRSFLWNLEAGERAPSEAVLIRLAEALGCPILELERTKPRVPERARHRRVPRPRRSRDDGATAGAA